MTADASRLLWSCVIAWIVGTSAPRVAAGDTWGNAIAHNITAGLVGVIFIGVLAGMVVCLHSLYEWLRRPNRLSQVRACHPDPSPFLCRWGVSAFTD